MVLKARTAAKYMGWVCKFINLLVPPGDGPTWEVNAKAYAEKAMMTDCITSLNTLINYLNANPPS